mgnify:CR=1 FL=1
MIFCYLSSNNKKKKKKFVVCCLFLLLSNVLRKHERVLSKYRIHDSIFNFVQVFRKKIKIKILTVSILKTNGCGNMRKWNRKMTIGKTSRGISKQVNGPRDCLFVFVKLLPCNTIVDLFLWRQTTNNLSSSR